MAAVLEEEYSTAVGQYVIIMIVGWIGRFIAEVTQSDPLRVKVQDDGPYAKLRRYDDFILMVEATSMFQRDIREGTTKFLAAARRTGSSPRSGLISLGVTDGQLHEILPEP